MSIEARLAELGIASTTVEHEAVFTVEQSQSLRERLPGAHTKNLFVVDKDGRAALVVAKDDTRVDLKMAAKRLGLGRLSFGKPERLLDLLGVTPGSVTPFAQINDPEGRVIVAVNEGVFDRPLTAEKVRDQWGEVMADGPWTPLPAGSGDVGRMLEGFDPQRGAE